MLVRAIIENDPFGDIRTSYFSPVMMTVNGAHVSPAKGDGRSVRTLLFQTFDDHSAETWPLHCTMTILPVWYAFAVMPSTVVCLSRIVDTEFHKRDHVLLSFRFQNAIPSGVKSTEKLLLKLMIFLFVVESKSNHIDVIVELRRIHATEF